MQIPSTGELEDRARRRRALPRIERWLAAALLALAAAAPAARAQDAPLAGKPWIDMDYGSMLTASIQVGDGNIAYKGIAVRLDGGEGGIARGRAFVVFDTDTLRMAAGWTGAGFIDWRSVVFDGSHGTHPRIVGDVVFVAPSGPGWARPGGGYKDPRAAARDGLRYGPLPREEARWKGLYRHGDRVVLSYAVGGADVLESPDLIDAAGAPILARRFEVGPREKDLELRIAREEGAGPARIASIGSTRVAALGAAGGAAASPPSFDGGHSLEVGDIDGFDPRADFAVTARLRTESGGTIFARAPLEGPWAADGVTLFVRGGRLCYDIGWVGVVTSRRAVDDGKWHDVALSFDAATGRSRLFVDGKPDGDKALAPKSRPEGHALRIGFTSPDFPRERSAFEGAIEDLRLYGRALAPAEIDGGALAETGLLARWRPAAAQEGAAAEVADASGRGHAARWRRIEGGAGRRQGALLVALAGATAAAELRDGDDGDLLLRLPAGAAPARFALLLRRAAAADDEAVAALAAAASAADPVDPSAWTRGGPRRFEAQARTRIERVAPAADSPFEVESLAAPLDNPYRSWMRIGAFDFADDGRRAVLCTWMGDVWTVDGLLDPSGELRWRRIAAGLFQPLGLVVDDGETLVLGRDQITRLRDLDGDGEADFYECFNNDAQVTEHFHEFAMDLQRGPDGDLYYTKGGRHALDAVVPQHGTLIKVSRDGARSEIVANGFRAPNGLCVNPDGSFIVSDQEGHWTPENRINWVRPGGFYGYMWSYHRGEPPSDYAPPLCWVDHDLDRSPAEQLWLRGASWGPLDGKLVSLSYGSGEILIVPHETVGGVRQGAVARLPLAAFPTGLMRGRLAPGDGALVLCGLFGWSSNRSSPGGLFRVRLGAAPLRTVTGIHATRRGIVLRFASALDRRRAASPGGWRVERWDYKWLARYGTDDFRVADGKPGREEVALRAVKVSEDGKSVLLEIDDMRPAMQMRIDCRQRTADGGRLAQTIHATVHALGEATALREEFGE